MSDKRPKYAIGYHSFGVVHTRFCYSLASLAAASGGQLFGLIEMRGPYTEECRNEIVRHFLHPSYEQVPYLLMVDADIEFDREAPVKTIEVAEKYGADVVWGNYALGLISHSIFGKREETDEGKPLDLHPNEVVEGVYAGGTGWCLMKRSMLKKLFRASGDTWFDRVRVPGTEKPMVLLGEDIAFGRRCWYAGAKQVGFTGLKLIHHKTHATVPSFMASAFGERGSERLEAVSG